MKNTNLSIMLTSAFVLCTISTAKAQNSYDDMYFVPSKSRQVAVSKPTTTTTTTVTTSGGVNTRQVSATTPEYAYAMDNSDIDVDAYNRRYTEEEIANPDTIYYQDEQDSNGGTTIIVNGGGGDYNSLNAAYAAGYADGYTYTNRLARFHSPYATMCSSSRRSSASR